MVPLVAEDPAKALDVTLVELAVPRRRALRVEQPLALEKADLGDGDVGKGVLQEAEHLADGEVGAIGSGGRHGRPARNSSLNVPICSSSPSASAADSTRSWLR